MNVSKLTLIITGITIVIILIVFLIKIKTHQAASFTQPITSINLSPTSINDSLVSCDETRLHRGEKSMCEEGFECFRVGSIEGCPRGQDCSKITQTPLGDNKCHKRCSSDSDCISSEKCSSISVAYGDVVEKTPNICM